MLGSRCSSKLLRFRIRQNGAAVSYRAPVEGLTPSTKVREGSVGKVLARHKNLS